jgi:ATP-binding cassette subfamily B protein
MTKREFRPENEHHYNRSSPVAWIVSHLLRYPVLPLASVLSSVVDNTLNSQIQVLIGRGFDLISIEGWAASPLLTLALTIGALAIGVGVSGLLRNFAFQVLSQRIERNARDELYVSLLGKSQTFHNRQRIGDIMARATNDVRMLNFMFSPGVRLIGESVLGIVIPLLLIGRLNLNLLMVPGLFILLLGLTVYDYNRRLHPVSSARREQFGKMNAGLAETISGIEVVKANVQERSAWDAFVGDARLFRDYFVRQGVIQARYWPMLVFTVCYSLAFVHAFFVWRAGQISLGQVVAFIGLFGLFRFPTFISIFSFELVQQGVASAERILELVNTETELDENVAGVSRPIEGRVAFEHVTFGYDGKPVLKDISFSAQPGETIAIVGQTGSGKTTLTRLVNRIFDADSGRVLVDGIPVQEWNLQSLRSQVSVIEQDVFLFSRTLAENIAFGDAEASQEEIEAAARAAQAHDFITGFSDGYETEIGERGVTLSGGQRQRIAIARAFLTDPCILILDDSTSAIDSATEDQIQRAMRRISRQRTTFLITHRLSQIRWADRILVLRRGELVDQGSHEELMERCEAYRRIFARYE